MSFQWQSFQTLANELNAEQKIPEIKEAYFRSAISRSYYAAFCCARDLLSKNGVELPKKEIHEFVRNYYQASNNRIYIAVGTNLQRLFNYRVNADYRAAPAIEINHAITCSSLASMILNSLNRIGDDSAHH
ncbi:MAG TPA: HEPN domain-containing protein [Syntrophorhabdaceae bacterium]|nr:HEPN domain-containing protein [Syntrophorhabdaceae bacterium]